MMSSQALSQAEGITSVDWETIQHNAVYDQECVALCQLIQDGFPSSRNDMPTNLLCYWNMQDELYVVDGVPFKGKKMLVPKPLRSIVLEGLHAAHQGVSSMLANAQQRLFWPGLDAAVQFIECNAASVMSRLHPKPRSPHNIRHDSHHLS